MQIIRGSNGLTSTDAGCVVGIGIFDGVHRGHQELFAQVLRLARQANVPSCAYTFDPHPARLLNPIAAPKLIEPLHMRLARLDMLGVDTVIVEPFTPELASLDAETFAREVLVTRLGARDVVMGTNFTFGRNRRGDVTVLGILGEQLGFGVHPVELLRLDTLTVSSSKVREYVWAGAVRGAALLLGRPFELSGLVVRGAERGTSLGFATANVASRNELWPTKGVYVGLGSGVFGEYQAVVNVGHAPTFGGTELKIEAHLLDYPGDPLYGAEMTVCFVDRLRDEMRFTSVDALKTQIQRDIDNARRILSQAA